ncbi:hypothetical protein HHI36_021022 [Cryptolaemus montrouzieri]|uniref:Fatty acyl-CoA reductase n=1 Tax=Cryptolaemus montrouzieri TaxID=559131 RepID=A0ABD2MVR0_9CUCU
MEIQKETIQDMQLTPIQTFYNNAHIFITGGTGFLGRVLLEKLLRSCPNISTIYMLVRNKKGKNLTARIDELFDDIIFEQLRKVCPKFRHKVVGIEGDCSYENLGMSEQDRRTLIDNVDIIFHAAATVRFDEKMKLAVGINVRAPKCIVEMAQQMKNLRSFMHVSTAYTNCIEPIIEEKLYPAPMDGEKLIIVANSMSDKLLDEITPQLIGKWPNTYTFTKAVAEHVVADKARGLPAAIFRPSIIISTYKEPIPAWINNMYGPTGICAAAGSGILRTINCDASVNGNMVPVDMCVNSLIAVAYEVGTNFAKHKTENVNQEIPIYHYESSNDQPITWGRFMNLNATHGVKYPHIRSVWCYSLTLLKNKYAYLVLMFLLHLIPAVIVDGALLCLGKHPMMLKIYKKIHKFSDVLAYFTTRQFKYRSDRVQTLIGSMSEKDKEIFFCDLRQLNWEAYFQVYLKGVRIYLLQDDMKTLDEAKIKYRRFVILHQTLKAILAVVFLRILWSIVSFFYTMFS